MMYNQAYALMFTICFRPKFPGFCFTIHFLCSLHSICFKIWLTPGLWSHNSFITLRSFRPFRQKQDQLVPYYLCCWDCAKPIWAGQVLTALELELSYQWFGSTDGPSCRSALSTGLSGFVLIVLVFTTLIMRTILSHYSTLQVLDRN